jgi:uncharacterized membrane protein YraQ (UPF0718 family)
MLEELQSLSETNKKRVLIISTTIIMIIIIGVWFSYFSNTIGSVAQQPAAQDTDTSSIAVAPAPIVVAPTMAPAQTPAQASGPSLWQNIKNWFGGIINIFKKPSQYEIHPQSN